MKLNIPFLFFSFSLISLLIGVFQFIKGETWEPLLSLVYSLVFFAGGMAGRSKKVKGKEMDNKYFNTFLLVSAFLMPVYLIFYPPLTNNSADPFIRTLWKFVIAGFCFYGILAVMLFIV